MITKPCNVTRLKRGKIAFAFRFTEKIGESSYTAKFRPLKLTTYVAFTDPAKAEAFERYLKSGSGHAFARKRLWYSRSLLYLACACSCGSAFLDHVQFLAQLHPASMRQDAAEIYARVDHAIAADNRAGIDHSVAADLGSIADDCTEFS